MIPSAYRPDVDGLRALAIVPVVLYHAFPDLLPGGFVGVDVFFVVSGYLITRIIAANLARGTFSFAEFYARRIRRLFPALLLVLAATLALGWALLGREDFSQLSKHAMAGATFTSNLLLWREAGYFDAAAELKPFLNLWSLGVEEQFYLLWPLLAVAAWRLRASIAVVALVVGAASFLANGFEVINDPDGAFYSPATRLWELMIGCALAAREEAGAGRARTQRDAELDAAAGLLLILLGLVLIDRERAFPGAWALLPALGAMLLIRSGPQSWPNRILFARRPMVALGLMSYALYLWHWPLLAFLRILNPDGVPVAWRLLALALSAVLAWLTFRLLELRVRAQPQRARIPLLVGLAALVAAVGLSFHRAQSEPGTALEARLAAAQSWPIHEGVDPRCKAKYRATAFCLVARPEAAPTHALLGDSHASAFYPGLAEAIAAQGGNLLHLGAPGCAPLLDLDSSNAAGCAAVGDAIIAAVAGEKSIRTVVLAANWRAYALGERFSAYQNRQVPKLVLRSGRVSEDAGNPAVFSAALVDTVDRLRAAGKRVVFLKQVPELAMRFESCLGLLRAAQTEVWDDRTCAVARERVDRYVGEYSRLVDKALAGKGGVTVLDPIEVLCDRKYCYALRDAALLYRDDVHLGILGSRYVAARLWRRFD